METHYASKEYARSNAIHAQEKMPLIRIDLYCDGSGCGAAPYGFCVIEHYIDDTIGIAGAFGANVSVDSVERDFIGTNCDTLGTTTKS